VGQPSRWPFLRQDPGHVLDRFGPPLPPFSRLAGLSLRLPRCPLSHPGCQSLRLVHAPWVLAKGPRSRPVVVSRLAVAARFVAVSNRPASRPLPYNYALNPKPLRGSGYLERYTAVGERSRCSFLRQHLGSVERRFGQPLPTLLAVGGSVASTSTSTIFASRLSVASASPRAVGSRQRPKVAVLGSVRLAVGSTVCCGEQSQHPGHSRITTHSTRSRFAARVTLSVRPPLNYALPH